MDEQFLFKGVKRESLISEIIRLRNQIKEYETELEQLRSEADEVHKLKNEYKQRVSDAYWAPTKNERGAGRKTVLSNGVIAEIKKHRAAGIPFKEIAETMGLSVGVVHKGSKMTVAADVPGI